MYKFKFTLDEIEDVAKSLINNINGVNIILLKGELGTCTQKEYIDFF